MFVDEVEITAKAGDGGNGIVSFRRERYIAKGGPDGGDGGNGGSILLQASRNENTLANFRFQKERKADDGMPGGNAKKHGKNGDDLVVYVPIGTQARVGKKIIADLVTDGQQESIAKGGRGGFGNAHFTSSTRQAPRVAEKGERGEKITLVLELKSIADVGLVGLPNAGKSTLLAAITSARPKIANYPFTTLEPHLGVAKVAKHTELLIADIPGLIDGASRGKGLGDEFLRHVERTQILLHVIDAYTEDIVSAYRTIQRELRQYTVDLTKKPQIIALTKIDGLDKEIVADQIKKLQKIVRNQSVYAISAISGEGVQELLYELQGMVQRQRELQNTTATEYIPVLRPALDDTAWKVTYSRKKATIRGTKIERFAARTDFESEDAVRRLRDIMRKMGIMKELERKRIPAGTRIYFGSSTDSLEY